jgi:hypothetical protein
MILLGHISETYDSKGKPQINENLNICESPLRSILLPLADGST